MSRVERIPCGAWQVSDGDWQRLEECALTRAGIHHAADKSRYPSLCEGQEVRREGGVRAIPAHRYA